VYANAAAPTFAAADMTKVIQNIDALTSSLNSTGVAGSGDGYWANFSSNNNISNEIIFSGKNSRGGEGGGIQSRWRMGTHYNQTPGGWNGFTSVAEFYNTFSATDKRAKYSTPAIISSIGNPVGLNIGQMYAPGGVTPLKDRNGAPLVYTAELTLITGGATLETAGIRGMKYIPDAANLDAPDNDYVLMRHSDALLMKAEAILRGGSGSIGTALSDIATRVGATAPANTLDGIYAERDRELWFEGWRRNDMIRFGKFLSARALKPSTSDVKYLLYPIPADALFNQNLKQNPGY
ncbi:MAG: RagB/SusD family nutrient uptake outer membrane protein, partial [Flavobacterium sp.]